MSFNKIENINEEIVCVNANKTLYITKNNTYNVVDIFKSNDKQIIVIEDDLGYLNVYDSNRFITKDSYRDNMINDILINL